MNPYRTRLTRSPCSKIIHLKVFHVYQYKWQESIVFAAFLSSQWDPPSNLCSHPHHPIVLFTLKPLSEDSGRAWGGGLYSLGLAGSTKITHPSKNLPFLPSLAFSASSMDEYVMKANPFDLPVTLSVITFASSIFPNSENDSLSFSSVVNLERPAHCKWWDNNFASRFIVYNTKVM